VQLSKSPVTVATTLPSPFTTTETDAAAPQAGEEQKTMTRKMMKEGNERKDLLKFLLVALIIPPFGSNFQENLWTFDGLHILQINDVLSREINNLNGINGIFWALLPSCHSYKI
jgi:hypothetical protein